MDHWKNKKVTGIMKDGLGKKIMIKFVGLRVKTYSYLKALKQPSQKFWSKILTPYFLYINFYLTFLRSCCENIFKIICIVSEKIEKWISEFTILFLASIRSCLQFHWNWKYFSTAVLRLRGRLFMAPWNGFHLFHEER